ncbi:MAG TPA: ABC-F family ATP-binding cassette domain-containing protein [Ktedonobacterales bacterium]|nr:ABC-F family ATP-binding cassette domain-containing protein [Ktedonobacterales bacterium]
MIALSLRGISKSFGGRRILHDLDFTVPDDARIGLVGPNGAGKSTVLRLLTSDETPDSGDLTRRRGLRVASLPQHLPGDDRTAVVTVLAARPDLQEIERDLAACETELARPETTTNLHRIEQVLARQERLLHRFEELGGPGFEGEARARLRALGLDNATITVPTHALSGGQRKLVGLAVCLAQRPDVLLLDEPETHLDLPHREELESLIRNFDGAVVIISHDRYLLDETVSDIAELENGTITLWPGNYSAYTLARQLKLQRQQMLYTAQQKEIARLEEAIARFKLWASIVVNEHHIKQARNKQRQIDAMDKIERPVLQRRRMALQLRGAQRGGQRVLELRHVSKAFDDNLVLLDVNLTIPRGERVGLVGANGAGKSVLAKLLTGDLDPSEGERWIGPSISLGYFAQGNETLPLDATPIDLVRAAKPSYEEQAVALLGRFLFAYDQVRLPVRMLSGGERSRLQLLLLTLGGANCLILDEPTNHLDIDSAEVLEAALETYDGTVIVVSHDRYFLDRIADRIVEVAESEVHSYDGGYSAWHDAKHTAPAPPAPPPPAPTQPQRRAVTQKRF